MPDSQKDKLLFSVAGARGVVGSALNVDVVMRLSLAFCGVLPPGSIVVGRDTRTSGASLLSAVVAAVTACGRECIHLDIATTPSVEMAVEKLSAAGGVIVTASHNPQQWNALKFLDNRGIFITNIDGDRVYEAYRQGEFEYVDAASTGTITRYERAAQDHIEEILVLHSISVDRLARRRFKVVVDCINGAGSVIAPDLLEALGARVVTMNCKTDGDFYRDPEPRAENLVELGQRVRAEGADLGFALDPDADRLALVDDLGTPLSEEITLALCIDRVLETEKKGPVVVNMSTSARVDWVAAQHQAVVVRTPVGEAHVVAGMLEHNALIGGEGNGGVIYPELHPGRDAMVGMALILQLLAERETTLSEQVNRYPSFFMSKSKVPLGGTFSVERISGLMEGLGAAKIDRQDGVKAVFSDGWCHVRVSNTEGLVRIIAESMSQTRTDELQGSARQVLETAWRQ